MTRLIWPLLLAGCASSQGQPTARPETCVRAVLLDGEAVREIRATDEPRCARLLASALEEEVDSRSAAMKFLDEQLASREAEVASVRAELLAFRERESLLSVSLAEQLELQRARLAHKKKPSKAETDEVLRLEQLSLEEGRLLRQMEEAERLAAVVAEQRAEQLLAAPRVRLLEPCGRCPSTRAGTAGRNEARAGR